MNGRGNNPDYAGRRWCLQALFAVAAAVIAGRACYLQILNRDFLVSEGDARAVRTVSVPATRGMIVDRNNEPLAVSTSVASVWAVPRQVLSRGGDLSELAELLGLTAGELRERLAARRDREFVYLKRQAPPAAARRVQALGITGIAVRREYKRYYPVGEAASHLIGFTSIDEQGQEGIELAYDDWLRGAPGEKRVLRDVYGAVVQDIENIKQPRPGKPITLAMDQRLQYLGYRELKAAVVKHGAAGGMLLLLDARTAEVLALAVQPSFNPNNRTRLKSHQYRNRVVTDVFEPGSTIKPFTIAAALTSGMYQPETVIDTRPGRLQVGFHPITDLHDYGVLSLGDIIKKSSNVGAAKVALSLGPERLWRLHGRVGLGAPTASGYPGETTGLLGAYTDWSELDLATISYGYGVSVTALQLARAYAVLASGGLLAPVSFQKTTAPPPARRVMPRAAALEVTRMMQRVVGPGGSGKRAAVAGYHVAGKTGTVHKAAASGYMQDRYLSLFAGFAPVANPALVLVVVIDDPVGQYFGGQVAAPVFAAVMGGALRLLNVPPDNPGAVLAHHAGVRP